MNVENYLVKGKEWKNDSGNLEKIIAILFASTGVDVDYGTQGDAAFIKVDGATYYTQPWKFCFSTGDGYEYFDFTSMSGYEAWSYDDGFIGSCKDEPSVYYQKNGKLIGYQESK